MIDCDQIEDYLGGELSDDRVEEFQRHAMICELCQSQIEAHHEFQRLVLTAKDHFDRLTQDCHRQIQPAAGRPQNGRRGLAAICGVAASIAVIFTWSQLYLGKREPAVDPGTVESAGLIEPGPMTTTDNRQPVRVSLGEATDYLAVPVESTNPDITIFWLHPTVEPSASPDASATPRQPETLFARRT